MAKNKLKKSKLAKQSNATPTKKINKKLKKKQKLKRNQSSDSDSEPHPEKIQQLLEPFSKDQLITLLSSLALAHPSLSTRIHSLADCDVSHRNLFIHGLSWDTTNAELRSFFSQFGEIVDSNLVVDRVTGKSKGYAFVTFKTRKSAQKVLKNAQLRIKNRNVFCQLASAGPTSGGGAGTATGGSISDRKIYVSNVAVDVNVERLREFFGKFGEIESGPLGFDVETGKCKGYALFLYKSVEGARKALEQPCKVFEGRQLNCSKAADGKSKIGGASGITTTVMPVPMPVQQQPQPPMLAAQNMALLGQNLNAAAAMGLLNFNPLYGGLIGTPAVGGLMNFSAYGLGQMPAIGAAPSSTGAAGYGPYGGVLGTPGLGSLGSASTTTPVLGAYDVVSGGVTGGAGSTASISHGLQQVYPSTQIGRTQSPVKTPGSGGRSSYLR